MVVPENVDQVTVGNDGWIEIDLDRFGMIPNAEVSRVCFFATAVANSGANNALQAPKLGVRSPESAHGEGGCFC